MKKTPTVNDIAKFFNVDPKAVTVNVTHYYDRVHKYYVNELQVKVRAKSNDLQNWVGAAGGDAASQGSGQPRDHGSPDAPTRGGDQQDN